MFVAKLRSSGLCCSWILWMSPYKLSIRRATSRREDVISANLFYTSIDSAFPGPLQFA